MQRALRVILGMLLTAAMLAAPWLIIERPAESGTAPTPGTSLWQYWTGPRRTLILEFPHPTDVAIGDTVFFESVPKEGPPILHRIGEIHTLLDHGEVLPERRSSVSAARAFIYPSAEPLGTNPKVIYYTKPDSMTWVVDALLTPANRALMTREIQAAMDEHRAELVAAFRPVIEQSLRELAKVVEADLPPAFERHRAEFEQLSARYRRDLVNRDLAPLVSDEIVPIVRKRAEPVLREVGHELWKQVSLWRFGWRIAYDATPLPEKNLTDREWNRFLERDALPILEKHSDEIAKMIRDAMTDVARDEQVKAETRKILIQVANDPELRALLRTLFEEVVVRNPHFRAVLERELSSPEMRQAIEVASSRLEPVIRHIGDVILGTKASGISPEFALVLRTEILDKDERWFLVRAAPDAGAEVDQPQQSVAVEYASEP
jgi:hypothetical protein